MESIKILVVVDVQNDFVTGSLGNEEAQKRIPNIVEKIKNFRGDYIVFTRDTHNTDYLNTKEGISLPVEHCIKGTDGWVIVPEVVDLVRKIEKVGNIKIKYFDKPTFGSADLRNFFIGLEEGIGEETPLDIEFIGFCTDICVVSNVLVTKTFFYNIADITVDASCCAGVTPESHKAALTTMKMCQINVVNENE